MSFHRILLAFLLYTISLTSALQCTVDCSFKSDLDTPFEIPKSCNQSQSSIQCAFRMSYWYHRYYSYLSFEIGQANGSSGMYHSTGVRFSNDGSLSFDYSVSHLCDHSDDCAIEFATKTMSGLLQRLKFNYTTLGEELWPLLASSSPIEDADLSCFDSDENIRQCGLVTRPGICQGAQRLRRNSRTNRGCNNQLYGNDKSVTAYDFGNFGSFEIRCNRSLCNGPLTFQAVKDVMFKYNITKTVDGQLSQGIRHSLSFIFVILIIIRLI
ncbi:unnamed protein product [Adineta ricciae]|uniref:Uncharacterized protein n=1 Tax=Adineta ricciae TaxID=249248 RepID=A0A815QFL8_ADIRI|nr:unnamed protein product [Adineta ricciae]CAF1461466.1 unnamed protein product [Adineta ricciae]